MFQWQEDNKQIHCLAKLLPSACLQGEAEALRRQMGKTAVLHAEEMALLEEQVAELSRTTTAKDETIR